MAGILDFLFGQGALNKAAQSGQPQQNPAPAPDNAAARNAAYAAQKLSQVQPGNLNLNSLPAIKNPDGSMAPRTMIVPDGKGNSVIIPMVGPQGQLLSQQDAMRFYMGSGKHLGVFKTPEAASAYQQILK